MATDMATSTSMGIVLNELIIAAAILDDVIASIILSELQALADPTAASILLPIGIGYLAIKWIPIVFQV